MGKFDEEDMFLSPQRSTKPPPRPKGLEKLSGVQETKAKLAEALYSRARREGWTRRRFYNELTRKLPGYANLRREIRDNLIDNYQAPRLTRLRKTVPPGYHSRSVHQESAIEVYNYYVQYFGIDYVILEDSEGGYQVYVPDDTP